MPKLITNDDLLSTLMEFRLRGDDRWALKAELPSEEMIREIVEEVGGAGAQSLTAEDVLEILQMMNEGPQQ